MLKQALINVAAHLAALAELPGGAYHYVPDHPPQEAWATVTATAWTPYDTPNRSEIDVEAVIMGPLLRTVSLAATESFHDLWEAVMIDLAALPVISGIEALRFDGARDLRIIEVGEDTRYAVTAELRIVLTAP